MPRLKFLSVMTSDFILDCIDLIAMPMILAKDTFCKDCPLIYICIITWDRGQLKINFTRIFIVFTKLPKWLIAITCLSHKRPNLEFNSATNEHCLQY